MSIFFRRKYKFTDKKHSKGGLIASGLFLFSILSLFLGIYISYKNKGNGGMMVGVLGTLALLLSIAGFTVGMKSIKEDNVFLMFPWVGTVGNAIILIGLGAIILIGI